MELLCTAIKTKMVIDLFEVETKLDKVVYTFIFLYMIQLGKGYSEWLLDGTYEYWWNSRLSIPIAYIYSDDENRKRKRVLQYIVTTFTSS